MAYPSSVENHEGPDLPTRGEAQPPRRLRGFAAMDPERRRRVSRDGGKAAHLKGTGHEFTSDEARAAGRKGGRASAVARAARTPPGAEPAAVIAFRAPQTPK